MGLEEKIAEELMGSQGVFTDGKPRITTEEDCNRPWYGKARGEAFRCGICNHKFIRGDYHRWVFTNGVHGAAGGNPFVCQKCDGDDVIDRWTKKCKKRLERMESYE